MNVIRKLTSVYVYRSDKASWSSTAPRDIHIMSYQVTGSYDHMFDFGVLHVKSNHIFNISSQDSYSVRRVEAGYAICFAFTSDQPIQTETIDCSDNPRFLMLFRKLLNYRNLNIESNYYMALSVVYEIIALMNVEKSKEYFQSSKNACFAEVREFLGNHFCDSDIDLCAIRGRYGLSEKYFREKFKKMYGLSPTQYLMSLRLNEAAKLLQEGVLGVSEVAYSSGFSDVYYFSRLFKKKFLCAPSVFAKVKADQITNKQNGKQKEGD